MQIKIMYLNKAILIGNLTRDPELRSLPSGIKVCSSLAYSMTKVTSNVRKKFNTAYFGWTKFTMNSQKVLELKKHLDLDPNFIRFLILKTVKENTIAAKRFVRGESYHRISTPKKSAGNEAVVPINKEEIDKEIDALVAV